MERINIICLSSPRSGSTWLSESFYNQGYYIQNEPYLKTNKCNENFIPKLRYQESSQDLIYFSRILAKKCSLSSRRYWKNIFRMNSPVFIKCVRASHLRSLAKLDDSTYVFLLLRNPIEVSLSRLGTGWPDYSDILLDFNREELSEIYIDLLKYSLRGMHARYLLTWYLENFRLWDEFDVVRYEQLKEKGYLTIRDKKVNLNSVKSSTATFSDAVDFEKDKNREILRREWIELTQITKESFGYII